MQRAVGRVQDDPVAVAAEAQDVLDNLTPESVGSEVQATALWAVGQAAREQNDLERAEVKLLQAAEVARSAGLAALVGRIEVSRSLVLALCARTDEALATVLRAETMLTGADLARAIMQRGLIHQRAGALSDAIDSYSQALPVSVTTKDTLGEARLRINRGLAYAYAGDFAGAEADLLHARDLGHALDQSLLVVWCDHNLGFVFGRRGNAVRALAHLQRAYDGCEGLDVGSSTLPVILVDRAEVLANVGMVTEALTDATDARRRLATTDNVVELAETELLLARIALMAGDGARAHDAAIAAETAFIAQERGPWAVLASSIGYRTRDDVSAAVSRCRFLSSDLPAGEAAPLAEEGALLATKLGDASWDADARIVATIAGRLWRAAGDDARAIEQLEPVAASRTHGSAIQRVQGWQAEALIRVMNGNRSGARRAIRAGLDTIAAYRTTMAATDLRATVSVIGDRLSAWLTELAIDGGRGRDLLAAAEAWRAGALVAPVSAPEDPDLERLLGELRAADADRRAGTPGADARRARLETAVRDRARQLPGTASTAAPHVDVDRIIEALGDRTLIEYIQSDGDLHAVTVVNGRARRHSLGPVDALTPEIQSMRASLQRLARGTGSARSLAAARDGLAHAAAVVDVALLGPLPSIGDAGAVIVPTGLLHGVPWAALGRVRATPFAVAPSAAVWHAASTRSPVSGVTVLAAGPDLDGAVAEVGAIAGVVPDAIVIAGADATVERVLAALDGAGLAHFAAHGDFRPDNPQLCSLRLADGDLRVYDLERLRSIPPVVILSACDAGAVAVKAGDELLGFSAAVLRLGAASLVAPIVPVHDEATVDLMAGLHRHLAGGSTPAVALQQARLATVDDGSPDGARTLAAAASFLVIGS